MEQFKITNRTLVWMNGTPAVMVLVALAAQLFTAQPLQFVPWALVVACSLLWAVFQWWMVPYFNSMVDMVTNTLRKDPWLLQRQVMAMSGQRTPTTPVLTNETLLYAALILEELGETLNVAAGVLFDHSPSRDMMAQDLVRLSEDLGNKSREVRKQLEGFSLLVPLTDEAAVELLDGATDLAVVVCGLCESMGLPGYAAYMEVYDSNRSKANPATGVIDKTPDGKWIKGTGYFKPNLAMVLGTHMAWNRFVSRPSKPMEL